MNGLRVFDIIYIHAHYHQLGMLPRQLRTNLATIPLPAPIDLNALVISSCTFLDCLPVYFLSDDNRSNNAFSDRSTTLTTSITALFIRIESGFPEKVNYGETTSPKLRANDP